MTKPLVTISSAFYNTGNLVLDMIKSVFAQTYTNWELILIDDGSTDNTLDLVKSVKDSRIRIYSNEKNMGRSYSLNRITGLANGDYIARMDSDDICSPSRIEKQVALLQSQPKLDVVGSGLIYLDKNDKPLGHMEAPADHENICKTPWRTFHIAHGSIMGKKSFFQDIPYREDIPLAIDFNLFLRAFEKKRFANVTQPLYYYRLDNSFNLVKQFTARKVGANFIYGYYKNKNQIFNGFKYSALQYVKFLVTFTCFITGLRKKLMAKRFQSIKNDINEKYLQEVKTIKNLELPVVNE